MKKLLFLFIAFWVLSGCTSSKVNKDVIDSIEFGSGGGVSGKYQTCTINFKEKVILGSDRTFKRNLKKKESKTLIKALKKTDFSKINFNHPYNLSHYIIFVGTYKNQITWGDPQYPAPEEVKELYSLLLKTTK